MYEVKFFHHDTRTNLLHVSAIVEDAVVVRHATADDPEEYGPAYCRTVIQLADDTFLPLSMDNLEEYLDGAEWVVVES